MIKAWLFLTLGLGGLGGPVSALTTEGSRELLKDRGDGMAAVQALPDTLRLPDGFPDTFPVLGAGGRLAGVMEVPIDSMEGRIQGPYYIVSVALDRELQEAHGSFRRALEAAGWEIDEALTHEGSRPGVPTVAFTGPGYVGDIRFEAVADFVLATIHLRGEQATPPERLALRN